MNEIRRFGFLVTDSESSSDSGTDSAQFFCLNWSKRSKRVRGLKRIKGSTVNNKGEAEGDWNQCQRSLEHFLELLSTTPKLNLLSPYHEEFSPF